MSNNRRYVVGLVLTELYIEKLDAVYGLIVHIIMLLMMQINAQVAASTRSHASS